MGNYQVTQIYGCPMGVQTFGKDHMVSYDFVLPLQNAFIEDSNTPELVEFNSGIQGSGVFSTFSGQVGADCNISGFTLTSSKEDNHNNFITVKPHPGMIYTFNENFGSTLGDQLSWPTDAPPPLDNDDLIIDLSDHPSLSAEQQPTIINVSSDIEHVQVKLSNGETRDYYPQEENTELHYEELGVIINYSGSN
jgi:hypothetical protein